MMKVTRRDEASEVESATSDKPRRKRTRKGSNAGGKSKWMRDFFNRSCPPIWAAIKPQNGKPTD
jgi:hypothetical protein